ncbi:MAG: hypothetical protein JNL59_07595 [Chitinophagaceae bacterium]|jgi:hypothetical protein|nr:hypothetical protein [Chitinophagaceae bacterium]
MKYTVLILACIALTQIAVGRQCDEIKIDLKKGTVNKLKLNASQEVIKKKLPCATGDTPDGSSFNCGGGVFFGKDQFYFYSGRDYVNIRKGFTGTLSIPLLEKTEAEVTSLLGQPDQIETPGKRRFIFYKRKYGSLVLKIGSDKVEEIFMYSEAPAGVKLCL